jgi:hypothetical protein
MQRICLRRTEGGGGGCDEIYNNLKSICVIYYNIFITILIRNVIRLLHKMLFEVQGIARAFTPYKARVAIME